MKKLIASIVFFILITFSYAIERDLAFNLGYSNQRLNYTTSSNDVVFKFDTPSLSLDLSNYNFFVFHNKLGIYEHFIYRIDNDYSFSASIGPAVCIKPNALLKVQGGLSLNFTIANSSTSSNTYIYTEYGPAADLQLKFLYQSILSPIIGINTSINLWGKRYSQISGKWYYEKLTDYKSMQITPYIGVAFNFHR